jgi:hypothetical protein
MRNKGMNEHEKINYVEFPAKNIEATKDFWDGSLSCAIHEIFAD